MNNQSKNMTAVGEQIREARKQKGLTQEQLAEKVNRNLRTIQRIENSRNAPQNETLSLICEVLEIKPEEIPQNKKQDILKKIANLLTQGIFLLLLNLALITITGYLTINHEANTPTRVAAHILSFLIPLFIVQFTTKMSGLERMLKFGFGFLFYLILVTIKQPIPKMFVHGFYTTQLISLVVLYYGNEIIRVLRLNNENDK
jgi:transcriptional regulator with XRE-family HTH domain